MQILRPQEAMMDQHWTGAAGVNIEATRSNDVNTGRVLQVQILWPLEAMMRVLWVRAVQILRPQEAMMGQHQSAAGANIEATRSDDGSTLDECCRCKY